MTDAEKAIKHLEIVIGDQERHLKYERNSLEATQRSIDRRVAFIAQKKQEIAAIQAGDKQ